MLMVCVIICKQQLDDLTLMETSLRKHFLKSAVCVFQSAIFFGLAYQFYTFVHPVAAVFVFTIAVYVSCFVFVLVYFVPRGHPKHQVVDRANSWNLLSMTWPLSSLMLS
ncbi:hypothetical protein V6N13_135951 [Hibiscus sabdariffa]